MTDDGRRVGNLAGVDAPDPIALIAAVAAGDRRALARAITLVEEERDGAPAALAAAFAAAAPGHRIGITGSPGAGKSTLTDGLIRRARSSGDRIAVLAVDPTSPFTGGALLGDRVRMQDHILDDGVFVRSMATRGHLGGLSAAAPRALVVLEAAHYPWIVIETVGVGQDEVEVTAAADTVVVVLNAGWGDGIQAAKAGILEIADIFVVNKADRPGAAETMADLQAMLALSPARDWVPPIVETVASTGSGVDQLWVEIGRHRDHLAGTDGGNRLRARRRGELETALTAELRRRAAAVTAISPDLVKAVEDGEIDPWSAAHRLAGS